MNLTLRLFTTAITGGQRNSDMHWSSHHNPGYEVGPYFVTSPQHWEVSRAEVISVFVGRSQFSDCRGNSRGNPRQSGLQMWITCDTCSGEKLWQIWVRCRV